MNRGLIIGFGRAGQRHAKMLDELGIEWCYCDTADWFMRIVPNWFMQILPNGESKMIRKQGYYFLDDALKNKWDFAVISTPPTLHLSQIRQCLDAGLPVLCEKPLCALGQLDEARELLNHPNADKVMVAYNYRYSPGLIEARNRPALQWMTCWQDRGLPEWGLLLDHVSHDLDILRFLYERGTESDGLKAWATNLTPEEIAREWQSLLPVKTDGLVYPLGISIKSSHYYPPGTFDHDSRRQMWEIVVKVPNAPEWETGEIRLRESVGAYADRRAKLEYEDGAELDITADPVMYKAMWQAFLSGQYAPGARGSDWDARVIRGVLETGE